MSSRWKRERGEEMRERKRGKERERKREREKGEERKKRVRKCVCQEDPELFVLLVVRCRVLVLHFSQVRKDRKRREYLLVEDDEVSKNRFGGVIM